MRRVEVDDAVRRDVRSRASARRGGARRRPDGRFRPCVAGCRCVGAELEAVLPKSPLLGMTSARQPSMPTSQRRRLTCEAESVNGLVADVERDLGEERRRWSRSGSGADSCSPPRTRTSRSVLKRPNSSCIVSGLSLASRRTIGAHADQRELPAAVPRTVVLAVSEAFWTSSGPSATLGSDSATLACAARAVALRSSPRPAHSP